LFSTCLFLLPFSCQSFASYQSENRESLLVSYIDLSSLPVLAIWVANAPKLMLELFAEEATHITFVLFPNYREVAKQIHVRITDLPVLDNLRELRYIHVRVILHVMLLCLLILFVLFMVVYM